MKTYVMGDIHGAYKAMKQCFERSAFDYETDMLIQLGDITDGHDEVYECVEELLKIKNMTALRGNHDDWFNEFIQTAYHPDQWIQGGAATAISYLRVIGKEALISRTGSGHYKVALNPADIPETHQAFFRTQHLYYIDDDNNCFVHAGFDRTIPFKGQRPQTYYWNRSLWMDALTKKDFSTVTLFKEIFIGHTSTLHWKSMIPMHAVNIWNLDTGGGHAGRLTIMDIATKDYWQSDPVGELYVKKILI